VQLLPRGTFRILWRRRCWGSGGFGQVILCVNKLDGRKYAVKRIPLKDQSAVLNSKILREVATLSAASAPQRGALLPGVVRGGGGTIRGHAGRGLRGRGNHPELAHG